jgi:hypothetical protein
VHTEYALTSGCQIKSAYSLGMHSPLVVWRVRTRIVRGEVHTEYVIALGVVQSKKHVVITFFWYCSTGEI